MIASNSFQNIRTIQKKITAACRWWCCEPNIITMMLLNPAIAVTSYERRGDSNLQQIHCLFNSLFRLRANKASMILTPGALWWESTYNRWITLTKVGSMVSLSISCLCMVTRYWPFLWVIHRWPVNSPHKGQWCVTVMFSLIWAWTNGWVNNWSAGDLRRHRAHYDVTVMACEHWCKPVIPQQDTVIL